MRKKIWNTLSCVLVLVAVCIGLIFSWMTYFGPKPPLCNPRSDGHVLIISVRASGGHINAAKAIQRYLEKSDYQCDVFYLDDYDPAMIGLFYETMMTSSLGRVFLNSIGTKVYWNTASFYFIALSDLLLDWVRKGNYDCIVSVMPFTYKLVQHTFRKLGYKIPFIIVPTDFEDPKIGSGYWFDGPNGDYLLGSERLIEQSSGDLNVFKISGMIIKGEFTDDVQSKEERRAELGLDLSIPTVLVMFGACGAVDMYQIANVMRGQRDYNTIFVCGKNNLLLKVINKIKLQSNSRFVVLGFSNEIHKWMQAADILIGKPGPGCISESIASRLPMIFKDSLDIMLQERYNLAYVLRRGVAVAVKSWTELPIAIQSILKDYDKYQDRFDSVPKNRALSETCEFITNSCLRKRCSSMPVQ